VQEEVQGLGLLVDVEQCTVAACYKRKPDSKEKHHTYKLAYQRVMKIENGCNLTLTQKYIPHSLEVVGRERLHEE
jgi:hypothetical protein